ncbi:hypothetical protein [Streptomyces sp. NPDC047130]|uniref:hypothetical protein n=1 Tax=Streptomyces sp. NPDC047130 TaxID=3155261 RepID=UPI0033D5BCDF
MGFVDVAWDGGTHTFPLDTAVALERQGEGTGPSWSGRRRGRRGRAGCRWPRVDPEEPLRPFHVDACGFRPTAAGLPAL